jgi:hypothetical protein
LQSPFEPDLIGPSRAMALAGVPQTVRAPRHPMVARLEPVGIVLLAPAILALAVAILLALLGIFVVWLTVFWSLAAEIVVADLIRWGVLRARPAFGGLPQGAIPAGR